MKNKTILITGGTGSLGKALTALLLSCNDIHKLIIYSRNELNQVEMSREFPPFEYPVRYFVGDIRDRNRLYRAFRGVDIVIHAAALKHVGVGEYNPFETINTNIVGTQNVIDAAIDCGVERVLLISSDKAVNPVSLYGATKLCAEKAIIAAHSYSAMGTKMSVIRFGNFEYSSGSVLPYFKSLLSIGRTVLPVTDMEMTRFWIKLSKAASCVIGALLLMKILDGGEVFIPWCHDMECCSLEEKARQEFGPAFTVEVIGTNPGEKLHEDMILEAECSRTFNQGRFCIIFPEWKRESIGGCHIPKKLYRSNMEEAWQEIPASEVTYTTREGTEIWIHRNA